MNNSTPWNNLITKSKNPAHVGRLSRLDFDREAKLVLGSKNKIKKAEKPLVFVGTDVSGDLHLGHVALLAVAESLAKYLKTRMVVSLNEVESVCSRDTALSEVLCNKKKIAGWLIQNGAVVHSRAHLDYIYSLYKTAWFESEVKKVFGVNLPDVNYLITKLLPDISGKYKMSKTRPRTAISVEMLADSEGDLRLPENIYYYLQDLISILAPLPGSGQNPWLGLIGRAGF